MSQAAHHWAWGWWGCAWAGCVSSWTAAHQHYSGLRHSPQLRSASKPERCCSPGTCATHMHCSHSGNGPSITLTSSFPRGLGQDHPLYHALQFYWCWTVSSPFFFSFSSTQHCSHCNPGLSKWVLPLLFNCRKHWWRWLRFHLRVYPGGRSELAYRFKTVQRAARALNLVRCVTPMFLAIPCAKAAAAPCSPVRLQMFLPRVFSALQNGRSFFTLLQSP